MVKWFLRLMENVHECATDHSIYNLFETGSKKHPIVAIEERFLVLYRTIYSTFSVNLKNHFTMQRTL